MYFKYSRCTSNTLSFWGAYFDGKALFLCGAQDEGEPATNKKNHGALRTMDDLHKRGLVLSFSLFFFFFYSLLPRMSFFLRFFFGPGAKIETRFCAACCPPNARRCPGPRCPMPARPRGRANPSHYPCDIMVNGGLLPTVYTQVSKYRYLPGTAVVSLTSICLYVESGTKCCIRIYIPGIKNTRYRVTNTSCTIAQQQ